MLKINEYFDGNVKSIGFENKGPVSVGVMEAGEYTFGTAAPERMKVIKGELTVKRPGTSIGKPLVPVMTLKCLGNLPSRSK